MRLNYRLENFYIRWILIYFSNSAPKFMKGPRCLLSISDPYLHRGREYPQGLLKYGSDVCWVIQNIIVHP